MSNLLYVELEIDVVGITNYGRVFLLERWALRKLLFSLIVLALLTNAIVVLSEYDIYTTGQRRGRIDLCLIVNMKCDGNVV